MAQYTLFERDGRTWKQASTFVCNLSTARRVFQNKLLERYLGGNPVERSIRRVKETAA